MPPTQYIPLTTPQAPPKRDPPAPTYPKYTTIYPILPQSPLKLSFQPQPPGICFHSSHLTHRKCLSYLTYPKYTSIHLHSLPPNHNKYLLIPTHLKPHVSIRNIHSPPSTNQTRPNTHTLPENTTTDHHLFIKSPPNPNHSTNISTHP